MKKIAAAALVFALAGGCYVSVAPDGRVAVSVLPRLAYIPGTQIQVVNGMNNVFYYNNQYWRYYNGRWWRSSMWNGGWIAYSSIPRAFLNIPNTHPAFHVVRHHPMYRPTVRPVVRPAIKRPVVTRPTVRTVPTKSTPPKVRKKKTK